MTSLKNAITVDIVKRCVKLARSPPHHVNYVVMINQDHHITVIAEENSRYNDLIREGYVHVMYTETFADAVERSAAAIVREMLYNNILHFDYDVARRTQSLGEIAHDEHPTPLVGRD